MKVLIADDEKWIRSTLRSMLDELNMRIDIVGEAKDGEELIRLAGQYRPDVAFVDIRMPRLDGLNAIHSGRQLSPHTQWIILSGYSEFSYAREALQLGASDYLLKPLSPEDLAACLDKVAEDYCKRLQQHCQIGSAASGTEWRSNRCWRFNEILRAI